MRSASIAVLLTLVMLAPTALASWGIPEPVTDRMELIDGIYAQILLAGVVVFLIFFAWMVVNLVLFRPGGRGEQTFESHRDNLTAEVIWTVIPLLIVAWVGFVAYDGMTALSEEPEANDTVEINMIGAQWFWQAEYENGGLVSQQPVSQNGSLAGEDPFLIPADTPVRFNVTSQDVIHSFWIPEFGGKMDAVPGEPNFMTVTVPEGDYLIKCAEYCGFNHAYMRAKVKAVPMDEFERYLEEIEPSGVEGQVLDLELDDDGFEPSTVRAVADTPLVFQITNAGTQARTVTLEQTGNTTGEIQPGATALLNATLAAGSYQLTAGDHTASVEILEAETIDVSLTDFDIEPSSFTFETDRAYILNVANEGNAVHNLYLGISENVGERTVYWSSENLAAGETTTVIVMPTSEHTDATEAWCDISGHYDAGMVVDVTVE